jgi:hypothetical protein
MQQRRNLQQDSHQEGRDRHCARVRRSLLGGILLAARKIRS